MSSHISISSIISRIIMTTNILIGINNIIFIIQIINQEFIGDILLL